MKYLYLILSIITSVYLILSARRDLRERLIYSFPCILLMNAWGIVGCRTSGFSPVFMVIYVVAHVAMFCLMKHFKLWGDGDGDMFMLLGDICLACISVQSGMQLVMIECLCLVGVMVAAIAVGAVEYKVKNKPFHLRGDVAVVPGFAVVLIGVMAYGVIRRFM